MSRVLLLLFFVSAYSFSADTVELDPNEIQIGPVIHENLSEDLLIRIKKLSETFEVVDGVSYEESVDLYKRDLNPEANIVIYEEMARVYNEFCKHRCSTQAERMDVYRLVLLRSMFSSNDTINKVNLNVVTITEAQAILGNYKLKPIPITVIEK